MRTADAESRAHAEILQAIVTQKYAPGDHLSEARVAEELRMSRTPVRNALKKMVASGILEHVPNLGCRIPLLTPADMENIFTTRALLESQAAELATIRAERAEIDKILELLEREKNHYAKRETAEYTSVNEAIHLGIASLSQNPYLERFVGQAFWRSELYIVFFDRFYFNREDRICSPLRNPSESRSCMEHEKLVGAITSGDAEKAGSAMKEHVMSTYRTILRHDR